MTVPTVLDLENNVKRQCHARGQDSSWATQTCIDFMTQTTSSTSYDAGWGPSHGENGGVGNKKK